MELLWFYVALVLAISDEIHTRILWSLFFDFYIVLAGILQHSVSSNIRLWLIHELIESVFHFLVLSLIFLSFSIGFIGALIHLLVDIFYEISGNDDSHLYHRSLHFTVESVFFIMLFGL